MHAYSWFQLLLTNMVVWLFFPSERSETWSSLHRPLCGLSVWCNITQIYLANLRSWQYPEVPYMLTNCIFVDHCFNQPWMATCEHTSIIFSAILMFYCLTICPHKVSKQVTDHDDVGLVFRKWFIFAAHCLAELRRSGGAICHKSDSWGYQRSKQSQDHRESRDWSGQCGCGCGHQKRHYCHEVGTLPIKL